MDLFITYTPVTVYPVHRGVITVQVVDRQPQYGVAA